LTDNEAGLCVLAYFIRLTA